VRESLDTLIDLLTREEFLVGLACGAAALLVVLAVPAHRRRTLFGLGWGTATTVATLVGVQLIDGRRAGLVAGLVVMAVGGALTARSVTARGLRALGWVLIVAGACLIPWRGQVDQDAWFFLATPIAAVLVGTGLAHWRTDEQRWIGPFFALSAFGVWTTVPDTELARLLLGVSVPMALATLPPTSTRVTRAGAYALGGVFAWIPALGGEARPASIIGAWSAIGVIAALPAARAAARTRMVLSPWFLAGVHVLIVLVAARVIGLWTWAIPALIAAVALYLAAMVVLYELDPAKRAPVAPAGDR
jgi:MFS family permease